MLQSNYIDRVGTTVSDGADKKLRKFSASGNLNFKKQASQRDIISKTFKRSPR